MRRTRTMQHSLLQQEGTIHVTGAEALVENGGVEQRLATALRGFAATRVGVDVGRHAAIEDGLAVGPAIVDAIQTDDGVMKIEANRLGNPRELRQGLAQQR